MNQQYNDNLHFFMLYHKMKRTKEQSTSARISGVIKLAFFFYQVAGIIRIGWSAKANYHTPLSIELITSIFSIKLGSSTISYFNTLIGRWCPLQTKNVLLLGFASITKMCFESVHCIAINRKSYLYKQVETLECYQGWQYGVFAVIVGWIALFPFTLYISVVKVRAKSISPNEFLVTLFIPPSMIWFLVRSCLRSNPKYYETQSPIDALTSEDDNDIISEVPPQGGLFRGKWHHRRWKICSFGNCFWTV